MRHEQPEDDESVAFCDLSPDDQLAMLVAELLRLLCVDNELSLIMARRVVSQTMGGLYPHVAFDKVPVSARLQ
jgi:hypothetical protein